MADDGDTMKTGLSVEDRNETVKGFRNLERLWNHQVAASACQISRSMAVVMAAVRAVIESEAAHFTI
ncbi:Hypothetical protein GbCGDNIH3_5107 [Granulibacter bethesdensis]|uniref:Uncharacterized protein n=1 Tax=Granulibacter bethesdensis TaxID=364410 RepID=A0AAN0RD10_9PROT|nr:Hypothetical protein GbCGDNIH3_5107 [Granulibacter bethesdensis]AHJ66768.1 Hypothetical protein GbCGDNIH4_5107 [Granulibacter bethesdensis CGDNIH4]APH59174.1 Hypothetical protein GbCGDNIH7_5107 [Granulibacter bethesdensis]